MYVAAAIMMEPYPIANVIKAKALRNEMFPSRTLSRKCFSRKYARNGVATAPIINPNCSDGSCMLYTRHAKVIIHNIPKNIPSWRAYAFNCMYSAEDIICPSCLRARICAKNIVGHKVT